MAYVRSRLYFSMALHSLAALSIAALTGCPSPPRVDAGRTDAVEPVRDTDSDGLFDRTERERDLDLTNPDTDNDGFSDLVEFQIYADPLAIDSPDRTAVVMLLTDRLATVNTALTFTVRGEGGDYSGAFIARPRPFGMGESAADLYLQTTAIGATPVANVRGLAGPTFQGVVGRTLLTYDVSFQYVGDATITCMSAYPFTYQSKLDDVGAVGTQSRILITAPRNMEPGVGTWCVPVGGCF